jgi:hypothetical protein
MLQALGRGLQIQLSLIWRLQLIVARAYLKPVREGDLHLRRAFELLRTPTVSSKSSHKRPIQTDEGY